MNSAISSVSFGFALLVRVKSPIQAYEAYVGGPDYKYHEPLSFEYKSEVE